MITPKPSEPLQAIFASPGYPSTVPRARPGRVMFMETPDGSDSEFAPRALFTKQYGDSEGDDFGEISPEIATQVTGDRTVNSFKKMKI